MTAYPEKVFILPFGTPLIRPYAGDELVGFIYTSNIPSVSAVYPPVALICVLVPKRTPFMLIVDVAICHGVRFYFHLPIASHLAPPDGTVLTPTTKRSAEGIVIAVTFVALLEFAIKFTST